MTRLCSAAVALLLLVCATLARAQVYEGRELVKAELLADTTAITPGKPFTVGLLLHMAPGWHTYWKFPGDAGIPTETKWNLPQGWKAAEIQWPIPLNLSEPGDIQIYGYHDEVLLMQEITPPAAIAEQSVRLPVEASWLVCEKICIPGSGKLQLELPVSGDARPANQEIFERYRRSLPQPWPTGVATTKWSRASSELTLTVTSTALANYSSVDFFPLPEGNVVVGHPKRENAPDGVTFRIPVENADTKLNALNGVVTFGKEENGADRNAWLLASGAPAAAQQRAAGGLAKFLLFGFIGGFILNLMPCVLPVISLKIFGFVQHAGKSRRRILRSGLSFAAGIFAWFIALALLLIALKQAGHEITWAVQFTSPVFVVVMSAIVVVFALNLFGVFEVALPQPVTRAAVGLSDREGEAGSFFQGVFATVLATPCTAPFLGTALGFAFTQSALIILAMFTAIAAGMALPYVLLSAQPAWLRLLPKPGPWMLHVKQFMGFLLLATLLFLLWVLGAERGAEAVVWACCFLLAVSIACWMKGSFITATTSGTRRAVILVLMVMLVLGSGFYFVGNKFASARLTSAAREPSGDWQAFTPDRLADARSAGSAVFVDFTAAWCLSCKFNEATVLESSVVREAFQRHGIVKLKADWTNADPTITKILKQFGRPGVPLYVLYPPGDRAPIVLPELLTKSMVLDKLDNLTTTVAVH
ncbi:MAG: protein-disulfide reductase DsbD family protein [Chthoniobacterales bacterium]